MMPLQFQCKILSELLLDIEVWEKINKEDGS